MPAMRSLKSTTAGLSPFAAREKPTPLSLRTSRENTEWIPFESRFAEFQSVEEGLRIERVEAAHRRWILMVASCLGLGLGFGVFLALFTRYHVEKLGTKLLQSEERWTATLGSIGEAVIATDSEGRITFLNPVAAALTGWQPKRP